MIDVLLHQSWEASVVRRHYLDSRAATNKMGTDIGDALYQLTENHIDVEECSREMLPHDSATACKQKSAVL